MTKAREIAELGQKLTVDGSGNLDIAGTVETDGALKVGSGSTLFGAADSGLNHFSNNYMYLAGGSNGTIIKSKGLATEYAKFEGGAITFNEDSNDMDFRVESDSNTHNLFLDAGTGRIGIRTASPAYTLDVVGDVALSAATSLVGKGGVGGDTQLLYWQGTTAFYGRNSLGGSVTNHEFRSGGTTRLSVNSGEVVVNDTSGADYDFRVESGSLDHAFFVDGDSGNASFGSTSVSQQKLHVSGTIYAANEFHKNTNYSVASGAYVDVYWNDTTATLNNSYHYTFQLCTTGTGTDSGAKYLVYRGSSDWVVKPIGLSGNGSNHPFGRVSNGVFQIFHYHPSAYTINVDSVATYHANAETKDTIFGPEAYFHFDKGGSWELAGNDEGEPTDFRIESDAATHMFFVDGGASRVGINQSAPNATLHIDGGVAMTSGWDRTLQLDGGGSGFPVIVWNSQDAGYGGIGYDRTASTAPMKFWVDAVGSDIIASGRNVLELGKYGGATVFNQDSHDIDFRVESNDNTHALYVDASANQVLINNSVPVETASTSVTAMKVGDWMVATKAKSVSASTTTELIKFARDEYNHSVIGTLHILFRDTSYPAGNTSVLYNFASYVTSGGTYTTDLNVIDTAQAESGSAHAFPTVTVDTSASNYVRLTITTNSSTAGAVYVKFEGITNGPIS